MAACVAIAAFLIIECWFLYRDRIQPNRQSIDDRSREFSFNVTHIQTSSDPDLRDIILSAPLFVAGRGKIPPPAPPQAAVVEPTSPEPGAEFRLMGVQLSERDRLAIIQSSNNPKVIRAREGQSIAGWALVRIFSDHVVLAKASRERVLYLGDVTRPAKDGGGATME
jgi:hypothetical protein